MVKHTQMNCLSVFDHFVKLAVRGLICKAKFGDSPLQLFTARTQPDPNLPPGFAHKLSANYYGLTRDTRRDNAPPTIAASNVPQLVASTSAENQVDVPR